MGLLSSSSSKASSYSTTENQDKRIVADGGSGVISTDRSNLFDSSGGGVLNLNLSTGQGQSKSSSSTSVSLTQTSTDYGAIDAAIKFAGETVDAVAGDGLARLLDLAGDLFSSQEASNKAAMSAVSAAYSQAQADKSGGFDQRTVLMLAAVAGVVLVVYFNRGR